MKALEYLSDGLYLPAFVVGVALALLCAALSVLVVLRRLSFIGQGISHAALGGIGVAAALGTLLDRMMNTGRAGTQHVGLSLGQFAVVFVVCLGCALLIGRMARTTNADTAIGVVLVASMSVGAVLLQHFTRASVAWESYLFGSIIGATWLDAGLALGACVLTLLTLWWVRRPLTLWAFDPPAAESLGVSPARMSFVLMTLLALATVTAMKLAGVVLATALLVLPGAIALRVAATRTGVLIAAFVAGLAGVLLGLVVACQWDWTPGASIVLVLAVVYAAVHVLPRTRGA